MDKEPISDIIQKMKDVYALLSAAPQTPDTRAILVNMDLKLSAALGPDWKDYKTEASP